MAYIENATVVLAPLATVLDASRAVLAGSRVSPAMVDQAFKNNLVMIHARDSASGMFAAISFSQGILSLVTVAANGIDTLEIAAPYDAGDSEFVRLSIQSEIISK